LLRVGAARRAIQIEAQLGEEVVGGQLPIIDRGEGRQSSVAFFEFGEAIGVKYSMKARGSFVGSIVGEGAGGSAVWGVYN